MTDTMIKIQSAYNNGKYTFGEQMPKKLPNDAVIDENMTVKANREAIDEHNKNLDQMIKDWRQRKDAVEKQLHKDVIEHLVSHFGFNRTQAAKIEYWVWDEYHSCMSDYFSSVDQYATLILDIINSK